jgi:hypothetical protein
LSLVASGSGGSPAPVKEFNDYGPVKFITRMANVLDPSYLENHCLQPSRENITKLGSKIGDFFSFSAPIASGSKSK